MTSSQLWVRISIFRGLSCAKLNHDTMISLGRWVSALDQLSNWDIEWLRGRHFSLQDLWLLLLMLMIWYPAVIDQPIEITYGRPKALNSPLRTPLHQCIHAVDLSDSAQPFGKCKIILFLNCPIHFTLLWMWASFIDNAKGSTITNVVGTSFNSRSILSRSISICSNGNVLPILKLVTHP